MLALKAKRDEVMGETPGTSRRTNPAAVLDKVSEADDPGRVD